MAIVTSSIVKRRPLTTASEVGGVRMKVMPRKSGDGDGGVSHGGNRIARIITATIP